jgi:hypothetical protein
MTDVDTLVTSHTREELDQIAAEAGVADPQAMDTKADVAEAIVAAEGPQNGAGEPEGPSAQPQLTTEDAGLPEGWQLVAAGPDWFTAERYVESLGLQKVSEGAATLEALVAACEGYDEAQENLHPDWPNKAASPVLPEQQDTETVEA